MDYSQELRLIAPVATGSPDLFASCYLALTGRTVGTTCPFRFAEVDNQFFFQMGVDNVQLTAAPIPVPAAGFLLLGAAEGPGLLAQRRMSA